jgi:mitochondrial intermembrane space import and assembly protein 40
MEKEDSRQSKGDMSTGYPPDSASEAVAPNGDSENRPEGGTEEEEEGVGAFDPVTGEINWDCPCLGGMAHGPCGQQFREAFSCFVYSEQEPKGIDCVEKFKNMQDCFREHPDVYGEGESLKTPKSIVFSL